MTPGFFSSASMMSPSGDFRSNMAPPKPTIDAFALARSTSDDGARVTSAHHASDERSSLTGRRGVAGATGPGRARDQR